MASHLPAHRFYGAVMVNSLALGYATTIAWRHSRHEGDWSRGDHRRRVGARAKSKPDRHLSRFCLLRLLLVSARDVVAGLLRDRAPFYAFKGRPLQFASFPGIRSLPAAGRLACRSPGARRLG